MNLSPAAQNDPEADFKALLFRNTIWQGELQFISWYFWEAETMQPEKMAWKSTKMPVHSPSLVAKWTGTSAKG